MSQRLKADLALVFCTVIWGATFVVVKEALHDVSVFVFIAVRFTLATLVMMAMYARELRTFQAEDLWNGTKVGFFMFAGYAFQTVGLQFTTPSKAGFITGFSVVLVPVALTLFWGRKANLWVWTGAVAALVGMYFLSVPAEGLRGLNVGDPLVLVCAVMFALHIILVGHYTAGHSVAALSVTQVGATAAMGIVAVPLLAVTGMEPPQAVWSGRLIFALVTTAVGATAIAFTLQVWAQRFTTATHTAIIFTLEPVFAALTSFLVLHERLGGRALFGAALILVGILLAELKGPAPAAPESASVGEPIA